MNNRILVRVNTQFLCQVVGHHLMPIGLHAFGLRSDGSSATWSVRWKEMRRTWQLLGFLLQYKNTKKVFHKDPPLRGGDYRGEIFI